ncbi:hypothetical protein WA026_005267 [Henosepilachna vigintioctopunctata]|uniref:Uncharacterized protein n=1 Tax=Henosepilachna vigintioctopunctata TaxID=420089 RepID=A0AAW1UV28_9CUCU
MLDMSSKNDDELSRLNTCELRKNFSSNRCLHLFYNFDKNLDKLKYANKRKRYADSIFRAEKEFVKEEEDLLLSKPIQKLMNFIEN